MSILYRKIFFNKLEKNSGFTIIVNVGHENFNARQEGENHNYISICKNIIRISVIEFPPLNIKVVHMSVNKMIPI